MAFQHNYLAVSSLAVAGIGKQIKGRDMIVAYYGYRLVLVKRD